MTLWRHRRAAGRRRPAGDEGCEHDLVAGRSPRPARDEGTGAADAAVVIDLTAGMGWASRIEPDSVRAAELAERFRARTARLEAQRDLTRLRARHWSADRVLEEGRTIAEWWEHPEADPYAVLGLLPGARLEEAAAARRRVAQAYHPDRVASDDDPGVAVRRMVAANAAYDRLRRALLTIG